MITNLPRFRHFNNSERFGNFRFDFHVIPVTNGFCNSMAIRFLLETASPGVRFVFYENTFVFVFDVLDPVVFSVPHVR